jgi:hypothetical protein
VLYSASFSTFSIDPSILLGPSSSLTSSAFFSKLGGNPMGRSKASSEAGRLRDRNVLIWMRLDTTKQIDNAYLFAWSSSSCVASTNLSLINTCLWSLYISVDVTLISMLSVGDLDVLTDSFIGSPSRQLSKYNTILTNDALRVFQTRRYAELSHGCLWYGRQG